MELRTSVVSFACVKQGMKEVIRRLESHTHYKEGDIWLRRIQGQSMDLDCFRRMGDARSSEMCCCKEPFLWERYVTLPNFSWGAAGTPNVRPVLKALPMVLGKYGRQSQCERFWGRSCRGWSRSLYDGLFPMQTFHVPRRSSAELEAVTLLDSGSPLSCRV